MRQEKIPRSGMDESLFFELNANEVGHFWFESRNELLVVLLRRYFPFAKSYMEIGCGTGFVLQRFCDERPWTRIVGVELYDSALAFARNRLPKVVELFRGDARNIVDRGHFDLIGAFDVIEHIEEDEQVLRQIYTALKPGGGAILTVPQHPWLWSSFDVAAHHCRRYRLGELEDKARGVGFTIERSTSFNIVLLPVVTAKRLAEKAGHAASAKKTVARELTLPAIANQFFHFLLKFEIRFVRAGVDWPVGSSRVVVLRKPELSPQHP